MMILSKAQTSLVAPQVYLIFSALSTICKGDKEFPSFNTFMTYQVITHIFIVSTSIEGENNSIEINFIDEYREDLKKWGI